MTHAQDRIHARLRMASRLALAAAAALGAGGALWALTSQPVADFLNEGPVRLLRLEGDARRWAIGGGELLAVLVATGMATVRPRTALRSAVGALAMLLAVVLAPATALPAAALYALALGAGWLAALPLARLEAAAPGRHPRTWLVGGAAASVALAAASVTGYWLARPLVDDGRSADEQLAFIVVTPAGGAPPSAPSGSGQVVAEGALMGADSFHFGSGSVRMLRSPEGAHVLRFADYEVRNGPDLFVYLTPDPAGDVKVNGAISLGMVKATRGAVNYELPADVDPARFRSAVIWCKSFDVVFAVAGFR